MIGATINSYIGMVGKLEFSKPFSKRVPIATKFLLDNLGKFENSIISIKGYPVRKTRRDIGFALNFALMNSPSFHSAGGIIKNSRQKKKNLKVKDKKNDRK